MKTEATVTTYPTQSQDSGDDIFVIIGIGYLLLLSEKDKVVLILGVGLEVVYPAVVDKCQRSWRGEGRGGERGGGGEKGEGGGRREGGESVK